MLDCAGGEMLGRVEAQVFKYFCNYLLTKPKNSKLMEFDLPLSFKKEEVEIRQK